MTSQKLVKMIQDEISERDLGKPLDRDQVMRVLSALALMLDEVGDPDCVFTDKFNRVLADLGGDLRMEAAQ